MPDGPPASLAVRAEALSENPARPAKGRQLLSRHKAGAKPTPKDGREPGDCRGDQAPDVVAQPQADPAVSGDGPASPDGPVPSTADRPAVPAARPATAPRPADTPSTPASSITAELAGWAAGELPGQASGLAALTAAERELRPGASGPPRPREPADIEREGSAGSRH
ncbi:MAG TPA: hypothetical protein VLW50_06815 [Streptosporangiaceae bacterium]|nr:hypothetical protein [Streptosporangiaceae bacterium]